METLLLRSKFSILHHIFKAIHKQKKKIELFIENDVIIYIIVHQLNG